MASLNAKELEFATALAAKLEAAKRELEDSVDARPEVAPGSPPGGVDLFGAPPGLRQVGAAFLSDHTIRWASRGACGMGGG